MDDDRISASIYNQMKRDKKRDNAYGKIRRYCERCGHTLYIPKFVGKVFCSHCGHVNYYDEREKFKDKLKKEIRKR